MTDPKLGIGECKSLSRKSLCKEGNLDQGKMHFHRVRNNSAFCSEKSFVKTLRTSGNQSSLLNLFKPGNTV